MRREIRRLGRKVQKEPYNNEVKTTFFKVRKKYKNMLKQEKKKYYHLLYSQLEDLDPNHPKELWKAINNIKRSNITQNNPIRFEEWDQHFKKLLHRDNSNLNLDTTAAPTLNQENLNEVTCKEVKLILKKLKNNKSAGLDLICNEFLKYGSNCLTLPLVKLFKKILSTGQFPVEWNISVLSVLHKNGSLHDCNNYRGISISSCLGRLFTKILQTRISNFLEYNDLIEDNQAGFRQNHRTTDQVFILKTLLNKYNHKLNKPIFACFVDFSKAFDSVNRNALFYKMQKAGITGKIFELIKNMYSSTFYCIKKENYLSKPRVNNVGLKQGDSLSPTLFNIFLNDIGEQLNNENTYPLKLGQHNLNHLLFADDLLLISETSSGLQNCLEQLGNYCNKWKLNVNINKTKAMIFSKGKKDFTKFKFTFQDIQIDIVEKYKYLGIIFYFNGNLKHAADDLYNKGLKAFFSLRKKFSNFSELPFNISMKLFDTLIKPIITYGSEVWISDYKINLTSIDQLPIEKLQHKMLKQVLGINRYTLGQTYKCAVEIM